MNTQNPACSECNGYCCAMDIRGEIFSSEHIAESLHKCAHCRNGKSGLQYNEIVSRFQKAVNEQINHWKMFADGKVDYSIYCLDNEHQHLMFTGRYATEQQLLDDFRKHLPTRWCTVCEKQYDYDEFEIIKGKEYRAPTTCTVRIEDLEIAIGAINALVAEKQDADV